MRIKLLSIRTLGIALLAATLGGMAACSQIESSQKTGTTSAERGAYLVTLGGCHDCHTPKTFESGAPKLDKSRLLSGHPADEKIPAVPVGIIGPQQWGAVTNSHLTAWAGPWGVSYAVNLTPHETGLKNWTVDIFMQTMRTGKHLGVGRPILPPMPWFNYAMMSDDDLRAVYAYLQSLPPVKNQVPTPVPPAGS